MISLAPIKLSLLSLCCDNPLSNNAFQQFCPIPAALYFTFNANIEFITILYASNIKNLFCNHSLMDPLRYIYNNVPII